MMQKVIQLGKIMPNTQENILEHTLEKITSKLTEIEQKVSDLDAKIEGFHRILGVICASTSLTCILIILTSSIYLIQRGSQTL